MRKVFISVFILCFLLSLCACARTGDLSIDYGHSELYTREDMDKAIELIVKEFSGWAGCELHAIRYYGDECNSGENIQWMNDLGNGPEFDRCIAFYSDFHSPIEGGGAWNPDEEYTNWQWWLACGEDGNWQLLTWGY